MRSSLIKIFLAASLILLFSAADLKAQQELSLLDAIRIGLEQNFDIQITEQSLEIARNNNAWGAAGLWPMISIGVNQRNRYDDAPGYVEGSGNQQYYTNSVSPYVNVNWNLFQGLNVYANKGKLALLEQYSDGNVTIVIQNTIQGIILSYYKVLLDQEKLRILEEVKKLSSDRYDYMNFKKELGAAVTYDVLLSKNFFLQDSTNYLQQAASLRNSRLIMKLLMGVPPGNEYELTDRFEVILQEFEIDELLEAMLQNNPTIRNQYINQEILKKEISLAKGNAWPNLSMNTGFDQFNVRTKPVDGSANYSNNLDFYVNFSLNFNLFNGGNTRRAIQNAKIGEIIGEIELEQMTQNLSNYMINTYDLYNIRKQLYEVSLINVESNELNVQISTEKFRSGAINSFNFRDVQLQYLNAAFDQLNTTYNLIDTHTELLRLTGAIISEYEKN